MRKFKIIIVTILLLIGVGLILAALNGIIPTTVGPDATEFDEIYDEDTNPEDLEDIYSKQLKQYQGAVKPLGVSIYGEGSHRLEEEDKLLIILESEKINLPDFEEKEVKVRGFIRDTLEGGQKIMTVDFIEIIDEAGVKMFNEVGYEFSFSYPADWLVKKESGKVVFSQKKGESEENLIVVFQFEDVEQDLDSWLKDRDQNLFFEEIQIKVGDITGIRRTVKNGEQEIVKSYVKEGNNAYELRLVSQDEVIRNQYFSIVDFFETNFVAEVIEEATDDQESDSEEITEEEPTEESEEVKEGESDLSSDLPAEEITKEGAEEEINEGAKEEEEPVEETSETTNFEESTKSFTELTPMTQTEIDRLLEKGYSPFEGRNLSFSYPKVWYFSYLGEGKYGFTDDTTYKENEEEISEEISRMLIIVGNVDLSCSYKASKTVSNTTYTVCTREPGLSAVADTVAESISK